MVWFALSLCLLLQTLQYCTVSGADCEKLVERLNRDKYKAAKKVGENWDDCRSVFFENASSEGISRFFGALDANSWASKTQIAQYIANETMFASKINVDQLKALITCGATISPIFFATVPGIRHFNAHGIENWELPDDLLEYYDGPMRDTTWMTSEQFGLFGSKLEKKILCRDLGSRVDIRLFASISVECLRGLLKTKTLSGSSLMAIPLEIIEEFSKYFEEDWKQILPENLSNFPVHVWTSILLTMPEKCGPQKAKAIREALDKVGTNERTAIANYLKGFGLNLKTILNVPFVDEV